MSKRKLYSHNSCDDVKKIEGKRSGDSTLDFKEVNESDLEQNGFVRNVRSKSVSDIVVELGGANTILEHEQLAKLKKTTSMQTMSGYSPGANSLRSATASYTPQLPNMQYQGNVNNSVHIGMPLYSQSQQTSGFQSQFNPFVASQQVRQQTQFLPVGFERSVLPVQSTSSSVQGASQAQQYASSQTSVNKSYVSYGHQMMPPLPQQPFQQAANYSVNTQQYAAARPLPPPPASPSVVVDLTKSESGDKKQKWRKYVTQRDGASKGRDLNDSNVPDNDSSRARL